MECSPSIYRMDFSKCETYANCSLQNSLLLQLEEYLTEDSLYGKLHFSYFNTAYSDFQESYEENGYWGRKFFAIPGAIHGILKTIYHLAATILYGTYRSIRGDHRPIQANLFKAVRDLEETWGRLVTLGNDQRGSYLVQESLFQKECYTYFTKALRVNPNQEEDDDKTSRRY